MTPLFIDYETYFDSDYSLRKMPTLNYVRDPRFTTWGAAVARGTEPFKWLDGPELPEFFAHTDWAQTRLVSHNYNFDGLISHEHYGITPGERCDTIALCNMLLSHDLDFGLDAICELMGFGGKHEGGAALQEAKGQRTLSPDTHRRLAKYACIDGERCRQLYNALFPLAPADEIQAMDLILQMSTEGILETDQAQFARAKQAIVEDRERKLAIVGVDKSQLTSRNKFAELLRERGVEPPMKISPQTGKETFAFAATDPDFVRLKADPKVADLIEAKLVWCSNNAISRIEKISSGTALPPKTLPVLLKTSGAHTHRLSGAGGINMCNLNRKGGLREAIVAPKDHVIVVRDLSGIELRLNMWFSGQYDVLEAIRNGADPYLDEAAALYQRPRETLDKDQDKAIRNVGKAVRLGGQYGMGPPKFRAYCAGGPLGMDPIYMTAQESYNTIHGYRNRHPWVVDSWNMNGHIMLPQMADKNFRFEHKCVVFEHEAITLPGGLKLNYPNLRIEADEDSGRENWVWGINGRKHKIYGGIMQENEIQALAGRLIKEDMLTINHELVSNGTGRVVHQVYDEILVVCHERDADDVSVMMDEVMTRPIEWAPDLPLETEGGYAHCYAK